MKCPARDSIDIPAERLTQVDTQTRQVKQSSTFLEPRKSTSLSGRASPRATDPKTAAWTTPRRRMTEATCSRISEMVGLMLGHPFRSPPMMRCYLV